MNKEKPSVTKRLTMHRKEGGREGRKEGRKEEGAKEEKQKMVTPWEREQRE